MKKIVTLTVAVIIMCTMVIYPAVFADASETTDAYTTINVADLTSASSPHYITGANPVKDALGNRYAWNLVGAGILYLGNMEFGTDAPTSVIMKLSVDQMNRTYQELRIYALPANTTVNSVNNQRITSMTLNGADEAITDSAAIAAYEIMYQNHYFNEAAYGFDKENNASGLVDYQFMFNSGSALDGIVDSSQESNTRDIAVCGAGWCVNSFRFAKETDAYALQNVYYNSSWSTDYFSGANDVSGTLAVNNSKVTNGYLEFNDVDFGNETNRSLAAMIQYGKSSKTGDANLSTLGDIIIQVDVEDNGVFVEYGRLAAVYTSDFKGSMNPTSHYTVLYENITGVHDVRIVTTHGYSVRLFMIKFKELSKNCEEIYGEVSVVDNGDGTYDISVPVNMSYIKGDFNYIVCFYDVNASTQALSALNIQDVRVNTVFPNGAQNDNSLRADYGWNNTSATLSNVTADEIEGKTVTVFLWRDIVNLKPLAPASTYTE